MFEYFKKIFNNSQSQINNSINQQRKADRKQVSKLARTLVWTLRIFLASVMVITTYNVALALCDTIQTNYVLWLYSTIASVTFCVVCLIVIAALYLYLKNLTKTLSKTNV